MMRQPGTIVGSGSSDYGEMTDLQSLLDRISIEGSREDKAAVDEVAENLRLRLNLRVGDDSIFQSLAEQLLRASITCNEPASSPANGSESSSPNKGGPELQNTWSTETSSTVDSLPDARDTSTPPPPPTASNAPNPVLEKNSLEHGIRGRSPQRESKTSFAMPSCTPELLRGNSRPPTSDNKQNLTNSKNSRRSPSPFRGFTNIFSRRGKDSQTNSPAGAPVQSRSFERSASVSGNTTPKPPISPFPPLSDTSFGSSYPPTPNLSILGIAKDDEGAGMASATKANSSEFSAFMDSPSLLSPTPGQANETCARPTMSNPAEGQRISVPEKHGRSMSQTFVDDRGRGRSRTPCRMNPRIHTPSQSRSKSLPRTNRSDKAHISPFRRFSPGRLFSRFDSSSKKQTEAVPTANIPMDVNTPRPHGGNAASSEPPQVAPVPKSSPLKTPLSHMTNGETDCRTGKGKLRRKMTDPVEAAVSPGFIATDESFSSTDGATGASPGFQVDLKSSLKPSKRNKPRTGARRSKAQPTRVIPEANARTPAPISIPNHSDPQQTLPSEPVLTPMDTDSKPIFESVSADSSFEVPPFPAATASAGTAAQGVQFSLGDMGTKPGKRLATKRGSRTRASRNSQKPQAASTATTFSAGVGGNTTAPPYSQPTQSQPGVDDVMILNQINSIRETARKFHGSGDYRSSILFYTEAIQILSTLSRKTAPPDLFAVLLSNRAAGLLMIRAAHAAVEDCQLALQHVSPISSPQFTLGNDCGPVLTGKLYIRMARALLKSGKGEQADRAFQSAMSTAENALNLCRRAHTLGELNRDERTLSQIIADGELGRSDVSQFQDVMATITACKFPSLQPGRSPLEDRKSAVAALSEVNTALVAAPACVELHEKKIALLTGLRRWREVAGHCERLAALYVQFDGVFTGDLKARNVFSDIQPAKNLTASFFGDPLKEDFKAKDLGAAEMKLSTKAAAEAVLRLPHSILSSYLRALRLEERYPAADAGIKALDQFVKSKVDTAAYNRLFASFAWLSREASKLSRTKKGRERGDELFRSGDFNLAASQYSSCLKIDSEGQEADYAGGSGGRLHAVLHCNRAACLMAVKKFDEAVQECTAALRIHSRYMKAMLRRGRCYSRLHRYEEAMNEYTKWLGLVNDAKQEVNPVYLTPCLFDGPQKVSNDELGQVKQELEEARRMKERKEKAVREEASYRQERQKFHEAFSDAQRRREHWYSQQGPGSSRRWDTFGENGGKKRSPKQKAQQPQSQHSHRQSDYRRGSKTRTENTMPTKGTHYGVLDIPQSATESDIKKAYRKMALKYHPDKNSDPNAPDYFRKVKTAYEILNDSSSRRQYDQELRWGSTRRF